MLGIIIGIASVVSVVGLAGFDVPATSMVSSVSPASTPVAGEAKISFTVPFAGEYT